MIVYYLVRLLFRFVLNVFFRDIEVVGLENVPTDGPVILVGNHHNQFVDPLIILTQTPREVRFLIAAKSLTRVLIGFFARCIRSIPVSRSQDLAQKGLGVVSWSDGAVEVQGTGTKFLQQVKPGDLLYVSGVSKDNEGTRIAEVKSDTILCIAQPLGGAGSARQYKIIPHVDQSVLYREVTRSLASGTCICLFPEGGSHDRADLLPLKAGVAVMALSAMEEVRAQGWGTVRIVPCGMNYFQGHRFRSHVLVDFGKPIEVTEEMVQLYAKDRRNAYASLLKVVEQRLKSVTILAPDLQTLQAVLISRRIYQPENVELSPEKYLELNRRFVDTYLHFESEPQVQQLKGKALEYSDKLQIWGLRDYQVVSLPPLSTVDRYILLMGRIFVLVILVLLALPGTVLNLPVLITAKSLAQRHAKMALAASNVKITGRDVIASYKILVSMVVWPLVHLIYTSVVVYQYGWWLGILSWFGLFPLYAYATLRIAETGTHLWASTIPLFLSLLPGGETYHKELIAMREELRKAVRKMADEKVPLMPFKEDRIFTEEQFQHTSAHSGPPNRISYTKEKKK